MQQGKGHEGAKQQKAIYLKDGRIFSTGFSRMSERQYAIRTEDALEDPIAQEEIDNSNAVLFPFYDADTNVIYLVGKGDCTIRYFEITDEFPYCHFINLYQSTEPQRGIGMMPKRGCDVNINEISRFYKLHTKGLCEVIHMTVPRKSELFQDDLYPDTAGDIPSLTADEWFSGKNADPILISLKGGYKSTQKPQELKLTKRSNILDKMPNNKFASTQSGEKSEELAKEVKELKDTVRRQDMRLRRLEERLEALERLDNGLV
ncbi:PREDICTED: coronin-1C-like [Priapulus caudatus]|uniref:Coronin-1C-like n=1 Tax=Priapulus caudatus TaxID=37621 RepID=A0ABM1EJ54_PRICU|nr:PREDICTED: coronin-1C-like [Priapulus caudatus]